MKADPHPQESARLAALRGYEVLDTPREAEFDEVVEMLAAICDAPISVINLIDSGRQWFKAEVGLGVRETPIESSFCAHAILRPGLLVVPDTLQDPCFRDNPLVAGEPHLRFYAGALLQTAEGLPLGTVCVLDYKPRELDQRQRNAIKLMARQVMRHLELRRMLRLEHAAREKAENLAEHNAILLREVDHRVKNSLQIVSSLLALQGRRTNNAEVRAQLAEAEARVRAVAGVHDRLYRAGEANEIPIVEFLQALCTDLAENRPSSVTELSCEADPLTLQSDQAVAVGLIVNELIANTSKHAFSDDRQGFVRVDGERREGEYCLTVADNGIGLPALFDPATNDGLGMKVLNALVQRLGGWVDLPAAEAGTRVVVRFPIAA